MTSRGKKGDKTPKTTEGSNVGDSEAVPSVPPLGAPTERNATNGGGPELIARGEREDNPGVDIEALTSQLRLLSSEQRSKLLDTISEGDSCVMPDIRQRRQGMWRETENPYGSGLGSRSSVGLFPGLVAGVPRSTSSLANSYLLPAEQRQRGARARQTDQLRGSSISGLRNGDGSKERASPSVAAAVMDSFPKETVKEEEESLSEMTSFVRTLGPIRDQGIDELDDEMWLRKLNTAKAYLEDVPMLDPRSWLDWILGLNDIVEGAGLRDKRALGSAALQYRVRPELRSAIRSKLDNPRPDLRMLTGAVRQVCTTSEHLTLAEKQLQELRQGDDEPLIEYLRRFDGWNIIAELRIPTMTQLAERKTQLIMGLNSYTARLVTADLYQMSIEEVSEKLHELTTYGLWEGFTRYKRKPFMPLSTHNTHTPFQRHQPSDTARPNHTSRGYRDTRTCRQCGMQGHVAETCLRRPLLQSQQRPPMETRPNRIGMPPSQQMSRPGDRDRTSQGNSYPRPFQVRSSGPPPISKPGGPGDRDYGARTSQRPNGDQGRRIMMVKGKKEEEKPKEDETLVRPQTKLVISGEVVPALIDTGANVNVMPKEIADRHPETKRRRSTITLYPVFGNPLRNPDAIDIMAHSFPDGKPSRLTFHIAPTHENEFCLITPKSAEMLGIDDWKNPLEIPDKMSTKLPIPGIDNGKKLTELVRKNRDIFQEQLVKAGQALCDPVDISVPTRSQIFMPSRPIHHDVADELDVELDKMVEAGVIEPSNARHNSPLIVVRKPNGKLRVCVDLRCLNGKSDLFKWDYPRVDLALRRMTPATIFSKLDLTSGFWQLPLKEDSRDYTTFRVSGRAWRFTVVPFGWKNSPAIFQAMMDMVLSVGIARGYVTVYMDDILIHSRNIDDHAIHLRTVFEALRHHRLVLNPEKCVIGAQEVPFLGHILSPSGIRPAPDKLEHIQDLPTPTSRDQLRSTLGLLGYYSEHIKGYAEIARPLTSLLSASRKFKWGELEQRSWDRLRHEFAKDNPLTYMDWEHTKEFVLTTDASMQAIGARLGRIDNEGNYHVVTNVGRTLTGAESRYSNTERELLAIVWALKRLEIMTAGLPISIETDHAALIPILTRVDGPTHSPRIYRLHQKLERWTGKGLSVRHIPGKSNVADILSRPPEISRSQVCDETQTKPVAQTSKEGGEGRQ